MEEEQTKKNHVHTQCTYSKDTRGHFGEHVGGANGLEEDILSALLEALPGPVGHILRFMARYLKH